jgi:putative pyruvate formate lyase activating enzyme
MFRQKGSSLITGDDHTALSGIIVRHLVLPGHIANSISVLRFLAEELSPRVHVSLMAQYYPTSSVKSHPVLGRGITVDEYRQVVEEMEQLGIYNGWVQEFESSGFYRPDFDQHHPFE